MRKIKIDKKFVGENEPCFIIAEAGANHDSMVEKGKKLIKKAAESGADAIKFQIYVADKLVTKNSPKYWKDSKPNKTQYEVFQRLDKLTEDDWKELVNYCKKLNITFFSTPFDEESADFLEELDISAFKIAPVDITRLPLLKYVGEKGLPMILSTGMANIYEIKDAVKTIESTKNKDIILLHCIISYPTAIKDANLHVITTLQKIFPDIPVGFSDHTIGTIIPAVAVSLGAKIIEKHYTIDKKLPENIDHKFSLDLDDLRETIENIRMVEEALGSPIKKLTESEKNGFKLSRRSLIANSPIPRGTKINRNMISIKRPGYGIQPKYIDKVIGKIAKRDINADEVLKWDDLK